MKIYDSYILQELKFSKHIEKGKKKKRIGKDYVAIKLIVISHRIFHGCILLLPPFLSIPLRFFFALHPRTSTCVTRITIERK